MIQLQFELIHFVSFMVLSEKLDDGEDLASQPATEKEENLIPVTGIPSTPPLTADFSNVPRALPVTSDENLIADDGNGAVGADSLNPPDATVFNTPPPRAVIVEE